MAGGNAFSPTQALVPTGDMAPADRFAEIRTRLMATRSERVLDAMGGAAAVINLLPTAALLAAGTRATSGIDFVCSNVRAAPFDLYISGALMEANYPVGPLAGTAFNLTTMSYRGTLFLGLHVDSGAVADPESLLAAIDRRVPRVVRSGQRLTRQRDVRSQLADTSGSRRASMDRTSNRRSATSDVETS